jgi:hypothetical protein
MARGGRLSPSTLETGPLGAAGRRRPATPRLGIQVTSLERGEEVGVGLGEGETVRRTSKSAPGNFICTGQVVGANWRHSSFSLRGQGHEMNNLFGGLRNQISTFCIGADGFLNFFASI